MAGESAGSLKGQERLMETVPQPTGLLRGWEAEKGRRNQTASFTTSQVYQDVQGRMEPRRNASTS